MINGNFITISLLFQYFQKNLHFIHNTLKFQIIIVYILNFLYGFAAIDTSIVCNAFIKINLIFIKFYFIF